MHPAFPRRGAARLASDGRLWHMGAMASDIFNDHSSALALLLTRRSTKARTLEAPGPDAGQLDSILRAASRVPDHGKLAPWRFIVITDREALLHLLLEKLHKHRPDAGRHETEKLEQFARQAPVLIAVVSAIQHGRNIPEWEQQMSAGAACQNLLLAAHAMGFVGNWLSGLASELPGVAKGLGVPGGHVAGWLFIGTPARPLEERPRPALSDVVSRWPG